MSAFVIDASVALKWFIPEIHSEAARRLLNYDHHYFAPDLIFAEITNAAWQKVRRGELSHQQGKQFAADMQSIAIETIPCRELGEDAFALASAMDRSVYDAMYVALAVHLDTRLITADERLVRPLSQHSHIARHIQSVEEFDGR